MDVTRLNRETQKSDFFRLGRNSIARCLDQWMILFWLHLFTTLRSVPVDWFHHVGNQINGSWYDLPPKPVGNPVDVPKKPVDSSSIDENLTNMSTNKASKRDHASSLLQRQGSSKPARELTMNAVDGDVILEDFLGKSGVSLDTSLSLSSSMRLENSEEKVPQCFTHPLSTAHSIGSLSESKVIKRQRDDPDEYDSARSRRLKRMIKNRESAARSRERKQAYHSELLARISCLEEENLRLKNEKKFEAKFPGESPLVPNYQLRRTNSASF